MIGGQLEIIIFKNLSPCLYVYMYVYMIYICTYVYVYDIYDAYVYVEYVVYVYDICFHSCCLKSKNTFFVTAATVMH